MSLRPGLLLVSLIAANAATAEDSFLTFEIDRLEQHFDHDDVTVDAELAYRNDERAWILRVEGEKPESHDVDGELQLLYSKPWTAFFDWQIGVEVAEHDSDTTPGVVLGLVGEAPYRIETEARLTLSDNGDVTLHGEFERDFLATQRLVLQPRLGFRLGDRDDELAAELRLRYEISRKFVPYLGVSWERTFGSVDDNDTTALLGISAWF